MLNKSHNMKYGLKIWSTDKKDLFKEAVELFKKKEIDFVELYVVPDSLVLGESDILNDLKDILTTIHTPHTEHDSDVFELDDSKMQFFKNQIIKTADFLDSKFIVVHAEAVGDSSETFRENMKNINDRRVLIENMPKIGTDDKFCFGYSNEQLKPIKDYGFNFCFDFAHAIKSAIGQNINPKEFVEKLILELNPSYFHLSSGRMNTPMDEHMNLFDGEFDIKWIKETLLGLEEKKDVYLVFETPKGENGLENDIKNMKYFRSLAL